MNKRFALAFAFLFIFTAPIFSQVKNKTLRKRINKISQPKLPPSVTQVETAIPAFIGYTEKGPSNPTKISSINEYRNIFGGPSNDELGEFEIDSAGIVSSPSILSTPKYRMYYMLEMFFANGGSDCFIISVGNYNSINNNEMLAGLNRLNSENLPTLILFPDAASSENNGNPEELYKAALAQCAARKDRFLICDVETIDNDISKSAEKFRNSIGTNNLKYGAAYFPPLKTTLNYTYAEDKVQINLKENSISLKKSVEPLVLRHTDESIANDSNKSEASLYHAKNGKYRRQYNEIKNIINSKTLELPPSAAIAGVYATVDAAKGVWSAPANVSLNKVKTPSLEINNSQQQNLNVSSTGKSINAIRNFKGKGVMVWGARTLAGNDNEWRYISVVRFGNMLEKSVKNALQGFVNEPNDANTWVKVKAMTENYLIKLWRDGALSGAKPEHAYFVKVGLGETMTQQDLRDGNMIVEIGIAAVKPAEFIVLKLTQKMKNK